MVRSVYLSFVAVPALHFPVQWREILRVVYDRHTVSSSFSRPCRFLSTHGRVVLFVDVRLSAVVSLHFSTEQCGCWCVACW